MSYFSSAIEVLKKEFSVFQLLITVIVLIILVNLALKRIKARMLKKANSKLQISNIKFFFRIIQAAIITIIITVAFFYHLGSWTGLGVFAGLITAGLGFTLGFIIAYIILHLS